ncbi:MAG TPA: peptidylprolyl isomerase [Ktedonobacterales bacterium]|nr:peptidylprolyl isomerase [Ktedonobacterales bacterium]
MRSITSPNTLRRVGLARVWGVAFALLGALGLLLAGCAPSATNDPVLAMRVNSVPVTMSSYQQLLALFDASAALQGSGTSAPIAWQSPGDRQTLASARTETINFFKNTIIIKQQLDAQHIAVTQKDIDAAKAELDTQIAQAAAQSKSAPTNTGLKALIDAATPDAILLLAQQQAYTLVMADRGSAPTVQARGILVSSLKDANDIVAAVKSGQDFATLAHTRSLDSASAAKGGDLGTVYPGEFLPAFDTKVFKDLKGDGIVVVPFTSDYGVFQISGRKLSPLSAVKDAQTQNQYLTSWVTNVLMPQARVDLYVN